MKKIAVFMIVAFVAASSQAVLLMEESFESYAAGPLAGTAGGASGQVGAWALQGGAASWDVGPGLDGGQGLTTVGTEGDGDIYIDLNTPSVGGQIWVSYEVSSTRYGGHLYLSTSGGWGGAFGHGWNQTVTINNATGPNNVPYPVDGTPIQLVEMIDYTAGEQRVWVNPSVGDTLPVGTEDVFKAEGIGSDPTRLIIRNYDNNATYDNIRIGTTATDVIPEPSTLALFGLAGLALIARKRK